MTDPSSNEAMNPERVIVTDFRCERCGHAPGLWLSDHVAHPLPVVEEAEFVRQVVETAEHNGCGGRILIATEPYRDGGTA